MLSISMQPICNTRRSEYTLCVMFLYSWRQQDVVRYLRCYGCCRAGDILGVTYTEYLDAPSVIYLVERHPLCYVHRIAGDALCARYAE